MADDALAPRLVERRVDWFEIHYRVRLATGPGIRSARKGDLVARSRVVNVLSFLREHAASARKNGRSRVWLSELLFGEMKAPKRPLVYRIQNRDYAIEIDATAREVVPGGDGDLREGFNVKLTWRAQCLAVRGFDPGLSLAIVSELGAVLQEKLARVDVASTLEHFKTRDRDRKALVVRPRAKTERYFALSGWKAAPKGAAERARATVDVIAHGAQRSTGFTVAPGSTLMARVYDKRAELVVKGHIKRKVDMSSGEAVPGPYVPISPKGQVELDLWAAAGVDDDAPVARVEFQLRGEILDQMGLRDPHKLRENLGRIWRYCVGTNAAPRRVRGAWGLCREVVGNARAYRGTGGWMRMVIPQTGAGRKKRAELDPRWEAVRAVEWEGAGGIAKRVRPGVRGASWKQAVGASLGALAEAGMLPKVALERLRLPGETAAACAGRFNDDRCARFVDAALQDAMRNLGVLARDMVLAERGAKGAAEWVLERFGAAAARAEGIRFDEWRAAEREHLERLRTGPHMFQVYAAQMQGLGAACG